MTITATPIASDYLAKFGMKGFNLFKDGAPLPGMITVHAKDVDVSLEQELKRYCSDYTWCKPAPHLPMVEYQTSISKETAFREAKEPVATRGGSWMPPHDQPVPADVQASIISAIKAVL